jgi:aminopeptidase N
MMKNLVFSLFLILIFPFVWGNDGYKRNLNADVLHYEFAIRLNDSSDVIEGITHIRIRFLSRTDSISFNLIGAERDHKGMLVSAISLNDTEVKWKHKNGKLTVFFSKSASGSDTLDFVIKYSGIPADGLIISRNKYGDRTFFADHWPDRAENYLPCIDHPYDKASVDFSITAPDKYTVIANGLLVEESDMANNMKLTHWSEKIPLPVKVMTFGAARFAVKYEGIAGEVPVSSWVFPQNRLEGFNDYSVALKPMTFYCSLIGAYPFEKLANVQSKTIYGGLENAGAIFYAENSVTGQAKAERLIAHEIAHQWFGDCVTEADWHHIWLSEGFATYLTSMYIESIQGKEELNSDMARMRNLIIKDSGKNARPLIDTTITDLMKLLNVNSYQKGAWILHMLRDETGDADFIRGMRLYYARFKNSNALSSDFEKAMEEASGKDLSQFFRQWLYVAGYPELKIWKNINKKKGLTEINIEQIQNQLFNFNLELLIKDNSGERVEKIAVKDRITKIDFPSQSVISVTPDPNLKLLFSLEEK